MERVQVEQTAERVTVELLHPRSFGWLAAAWITSVWGLGALLGVATAAVSHAPAYPAFLPFALGMLPMIFLPYAVFMAPWLASGREIVRVEDGQLVINSVALGLSGPARRYRLRDVENLRFEPVPSLNRRLMHTIVLDPGSVAFDYGARTVRFGRWFSADEAAPALAALSAAIEVARRSRVGDASEGGEADVLPQSRVRISGAEGSLTVRMPFGNAPANRRALAVSLGGMIIVMLALSMTMGAAFAAANGSFLGPILGAMPIAMVAVIVLPILAASLASVETATLRGGVLEIGTTPVVLTMVAKRRFDTRYIHNIRYEPVVVDREDLAVIWSKYFEGAHGKIAFGYGAEQHRFGQSVDGPEAREIVAALTDALAADPAAGTLAWEAYQQVHGPSAGAQPAAADRTSAST